MDTAHLCYSGLSYVDTTHHRHGDYLHHQVQTQGVLQKGEPISISPYLYRCISPRVYKESIGPQSFFLSSLSLSLPFHNNANLNFVHTHSLKMNQTTIHNQ